MYLRAQTVRGGGFWNLRKPRTARYSHIAFNDISCVHCAPGFEIATHRVLPLLSAVHPSIPFLPPNAFLSLASPPFHSSLSPSRFISPCSPLPVSTRTLTPPPPPPPRWQSRLPNIHRLLILERDYVLRIAYQPPVVSRRIQTKPNGVRMECVPRWTVEISMGP